ncbi:MAG: hypothetical protein IT449_12995 [Phycisphaerales bacterium]|nr:hypothetical protein [Phycisphaerales bacterium]
MGRRKREGQHYLRVNDADIDAAAHTPIAGNLTQLLTQLAVSEVSDPEEPEPQVLKLEDFMKKAGDRIRTDDVQLGKSPEGDPNPSTDNG